jgi:glycosyltransferase involved in cell wall biosynthesis
LIPELSVVMPVHNAEPTMPAAIGSILRQSLKNFELVAVDDGSDDGSLMYLEKAAQKDRRIKVVSLPKSGIVFALNTGLAQSKAPLVARFDADDICHPRRLEKQISFMNEHQRCAALGSRVRVFPRPRLKPGMLHYEGWLNSVVTPEDIHRDLFVESPFAHPSVMFRKDIIMGLGGYRDMGWPEDYDLWLRVAEAGHGMAKLPETLLFWRDAPDRLSRLHGMYSAESFRRVKAHFLWRWRLAGARKLQIWGAGRDGKTWAKLLMKTGFEVVQFIDIDRKKVGGRAAGRADGGDRSTGFGIPVVAPADIIKGLPIVCAVGVKGAREQIRDYLAAEGFKEPEEFFFLA